MDRFTWVADRVGVVDVRGDPRQQVAQRRPLGGAQPREQVLVVNRLREEHEAIAGVLDRVDAALVAMVGDSGGIGPVQAAVDLLTDALLSHLSYEDRELVEPLARLSLL